jgi:hypothetical protein
MRLSSIRSPGVETPESSVVGCPNQILVAIDFVSSHRHTMDSDGSTEVGIYAIRSTLLQIRNFDVLNWTLSMSKGEGLQITQANLFHMCHIWRIAAEVYISRNLFRFTREPVCLVNIKTMVDELISKIAFISHHDELIKCLIWPTFIAGTECTSKEHQDLVLGFLDRQWDITLGANARSAGFVLADLWEKRAELYKLGGVSSTSWDWMQELSTREDNWLFF